MNLELLKRRAAVERELDRQVDEYFDRLFTQLVALNGIAVRIVRVKIPKRLAAHMRATYPPVDGPYNSFCGYPVREVD